MIATASPVVEQTALEVEERASRVHRVVGEHYDFVWRSLRRLGVPDDTADDAAQEVFCVFARRLDDVALDKEKTFLFGVTIRVAHTHRKQRARSPETRDEEVLATLASPNPTADELIDERRARDVLDTLLDRMPIELRTVFVLYEIEEMTMAEIATVLELSPGTVASRLRRARETFQELARQVKESQTRGVRR